MIIPLSHPPAKRIGFYNDRVGSYFDTDGSIFYMHYIGKPAGFLKRRFYKPTAERGLCWKWDLETYAPLIPPVFATDESFASYDGPVGYSWPNDPYVKGSYSYIAPGQEIMLTATKEEHGEVVKTLFAPIDQKLYFAGEHASILGEVPGTMEAACESGESAARMILNRR